MTKEEMKQEIFKRHDLYKGYLWKHRAELAYIDMQFVDDAVHDIMIRMIKYARRIKREEVGAFINTLFRNITKWYNRDKYTEWKKRKSINSQKNWEFLLTIPYGEIEQSKRQAKAAEEIIRNITPQLKGNAQTVFVKLQERLNDFIVEDNYRKNRTKFQRSGIFIDIAAEMGFSRERIRQLNVEIRTQIEKKIKFA